MAFHEIAVPHKDILAQNFSSEVYAAKLWDVHQKRGSDEYKDSEIFFEKTYLTDNLKKILNSVKDRLEGTSGGHFRSISTPFGGGKTHTLIALYHKCAEWNAKPVVLVGNEIDPNKQTLWGMIEEQLTGKITNLTGNVSHGGEELRKVFETQNQPILILIDELLRYIEKADGVKVENSTLATQTINFIQELSEAVSSFPNICVVVTLPSSANEQLDNERYAELFEQLQKFAGRTKDTITPVSDNDIPKIIRQRLFSSSDVEIKDRSEKIIKDFVDYCDDEGLIPEGMQVSQYREEFSKSYPFLPQVIDVLYKRWGTIPKFQRTRGVLRLLSLVINSLATSDKQFISLGDFDLNNNEIKQELVDYLDSQFYSVISKDITSADSGASKVNQMVPDQYKGKQLGLRAATAIFMYSHSGTIGTNGATESEIKRATCVRGIPSAQISEVLNQFQQHLFYLNPNNGKYLFKKEANILKMKVDTMENIKEREIDEAQKSLIKNNVGKNQNFRVFLWPNAPKEVENSNSLKLVIMKENDIRLIQSIYETIGESPRVFRNNILFLTPSDGEKGKFLNSLKSKIAWEKIKSDPESTLKEDQITSLNNELKKENERLNDLIKEYYSTLYIPEKNGPSKVHLNIPLIASKGIDDIIYDDLVDQDQIHPQLGALFLKSYYLKDQQYVETSNLFESMLSTPGERRPLNKNVVEQAIIDGVFKGEFGIGTLENGNPVPKLIKKQTRVSFDPGEIIIQASLFVEEPVSEFFCDDCGHKTSTQEELDEHKKSHSTEPGGGEGGSMPDDSIENLDFGFTIPEGQINNVSTMLLKIASHYKNLKLKVEASDGKMTKHDLDLIKETLSQIGSLSDL
ncbi:ATPase AAA protein [Marine Group I thaumarchaeote SCGC AAA799-B03]|uniref:ATPase AAA protein n=3 Tax=Marine Group I TaxID=905826 RepID=A0A087S6V7_9ARCH|nr:ATPase AAA protein [Marine Group I thaumarchaeote SCGC AAA799-N04]KFM19197.1 ATPase AAA+ superfamily-like protein [Marine Group I thaumarchaeote SCGC RSA3]KFM21461.1 ATPase AAA protein [Marine Group I thaumarchaeote SCGC AAA799-B03]